MELDNKKAYPKVCHQILDELSERLPDYLHYHCLKHTIDVSNVCNFYIDYYLLSDRVANLIRIAAVAHDFGYIFDPKEHEERSIVEVRPKLTEYSDKEIAVIEGLIRATKIPQNPRNLYEEIISDADLDYLGRKDYPQLSEALYEEFLYFGVVENQTDWLDLQIRFLESHQFHTDWAKNNRAENKQKVIDGLKARVAASGQSARKAS
jgi:predicted metal-dependent HD superfamily phosphohydrolase